MTARLRTSDPARPGFGRVRHGRGFRYVDTRGKPLADAADRDRIRALVIPPAWEDVWICPWPNGHVQAIGTDAAGRRQYLYHSRFREQQEASKHEHVLAVSARLPRLRRQIESDLAGRGLSRDRVLACGARLLDLGFFRAGGQAYRRDHESYGLTTLLREHVTCGRQEIHFSYRGKSGQDQSLTLVDPDAYAVIAALLRRRADGPQLLAYWRGGAWHDVQAAELNEYLRGASGTDLTAKDFRTWHATVLASVALAVSTEVVGESATRRHRAVVRAVREVSDYLGNTPTVCRASYISPRVVELFESGTTIAPVLDRLGKDVEYGQPATRGVVEKAVRKLLA
ncbi:DNA topoisomerase IB [Streptomyces sp. NPDC051555]|uniref:DNA topoisomerase IB n=1 Tax=Streptomyces sp. NPDC051555 TaxID=3365657 RepID=UPI0037B29BDB